MKNVDYIASRATDEIIGYLEEADMLGATLDCMSTREISKLRTTMIGIIHEELNRSNVTNSTGPR
jgi:hypothetical protein